MLSDTAVFYFKFISLDPFETFLFAFLSRPSPSTMKRLRKMKGREMHKTFALEESHLLSTENLAIRKPRTMTVIPVLKASLTAHVYEYRDSRNR